MNKLITTILLLFISTNLFCQIDTTKVSFVSYWSIGDSYSFKISKVLQKYDKNELTDDKVQEYIANFTVIDSTENSYTINWTYENDFTINYDIPEKLMDKFSKYELIEIKYKTSEVGVFLEVVNWKEVSKMMNEMFDIAIDILSEGDKEKKKEVKNVMATYRKAYSSKEGVEGLVLNELQLFHFPMGLEYNVNEPIIYDETFPNMFGGDPIKAKAKLYFEKVDFEENFCVMKQEISLDKEDTKVYMQQVFKQMKLNEKEMTEAINTAVFEINDKNTYEYYFNPGIPHRIETNREILVQFEGESPRKRIDKTIIELLYND